MVGNPPYGAKITTQEREYCKEKFSEIGSTDTAQLMMQTSRKLLSKFGSNGLIVPKALVYASNWKKTREQIICNLSKLIDCGKVWKEVKLEQVIYIYQNNSMREFYLSGSRVEHDLVADTAINKKECAQFEFLISGIKENELLLGKKIHTKSDKLPKYIKNNRGGMLQNKIKKSGDNKVIGGIQIQRYHIAKSFKGYINVNDIDNDIAYVQKNSILAQNIVAHIDNPVNHLKITATIPQNTDFVILDTVNQIIVSRINPHYVLGLFNSKIVNWYTYRFIFAKAIRTMHFDSPTTNKIPIIVDKEELVVELVKKLIKLYTEKQQTELQTTVSEIITHENQLNRIFYEIFGLTRNEIKMVEKLTPE